MDIDTVMMIDIMVHVTCSKDSMVTDMDMDINMPIIVNHIAAMRSKLLQKNVPTLLEEICISVLIKPPSLGIRRDDHTWIALSVLSVLMSPLTALASMDTLMVMVTTDINLTVTSIKDTMVTRATAINIVTRAPLPDHTVTLAIMVSALLSAHRCLRKHIPISIPTISSALRDLSSHTALRDHPTISSVLRDLSSHTARRDHPTISSVLRDPNWATDLRDQPSSSAQSILPSTRRSCAEPTRLATRTILVKTVSTL